MFADKSLKKKQKLTNDESDCMTKKKMAMNLTMN